jgi:predicted amidohydrolase
MQKTVIAAAQSASERGDIGCNVGRHIILIESAAKNSVNLIFFPELSLTGYEPGLAESHAFIENDSRLDLLKQKSAEHNMIIIAGAPIRLGSGLHIGSFIIYPDLHTEIYTKHYLHKGEEEYFTPGNLNPVIKLNNEIISLAICADISNPEHPRLAASKGCTIYLVSSLITPSGYGKDAGLLCEYSKRFNMFASMANYGGDSGGYVSAGGSAVWKNDGELLSEFKGTGEGLVIASKENGDWKGAIVRRCPLASFEF